MQFTNLLLPLLFAISGVSAQDPDTTSVMTYYTTFTVSRIVETTTCTSITTPPAESTTEAAIVSTSEVPIVSTSAPPILSTSAAPVISTFEAPVPSSSPSASFTTELVTQTVQRIAATPVVSPSMVTVYPVASGASASAAMPYASSNGTIVAVSSPTTMPYTGAASDLTIQFGAAAIIAAVAGVAQML